MKFLTYYRMMAPTPTQENQMGGLKPGRIVYYVLSDQDAKEIMRRRTTQAAGVVFGWPAGAQVHMGNEPHAGDVCPAMVLSVWSQETGCSNLKVMLDGTDEYWATSRSFNEAKDAGSWHWMFEGQNTRYDATKQH